MPVERDERQDRERQKAVEMQRSDLCHRGPRPDCRGLGEGAAPGWGKTLDAAPHLGLAGRI